MWHEYEKEEMDSEDLKMVFKTSNKTAFQYDAYRPLANRTCFQFQWPPPDATSVGVGRWPIEQVSNEDHQMPLAGAGYVQGGDGYVLGRRGGYVQRCGVPLPYDLSHDARDVTCPSPCPRTDGCENFTFPQLRLRGGGGNKMCGSVRMTHDTNYSLKSFQLLKNRLEIIFEIIVCCNKASGEITSVRESKLWQRVQRVQRRNSVLLM